MSKLTEIMAVVIHEAANQVRIGNNREPAFGDRFELDSTSATRELIKDLQQHSIWEFLYGFFCLCFISMMMMVVYFCD